MSAADATNLLLAVIGSRHPKDSVKAVEEYGSLYAISKRRHFKDLGVAGLADLPREHTFGDALQSLIDAQPHALRGKDLSLVVHFLWPWPRAQIQLVGGGGARIDERVAYGPGRISKGGKKTNINITPEFDEVLLDQDRSFPAEMITQIQDLLRS